MGVLGRRAPGGPLRRLPRRGAEERRGSGRAEYERRVGERFDEAKLRDALAECVADAREDDVVPFTALLRLSTDGRASEVLLRPPVPIAVCLRWSIRETSFPRPPGPGYWVAVDVSPTRAPGVPPVPTAGVATATVPPTPTPPAPPTGAPAPPDVIGPAPPDVIDLTDRGRPLHVDARRQDLAALRQSLRDRRAEVLGPILAQADGLAADDPTLEAYWSLAEELALPVVIPLGMEPPGTEGSGSEYRVALGDPLKLESVLLRHPKLRIVVSGAAWPMADAMVALMWRYPQVWVDTSVIAWALPRAELEAYLARLLRAGFAERILFASGASTARRMAEAADAIRSSDVLPPRQSAPSWAATRPGCSHARGPSRRPRSARAGSRAHRLRPGGRRPPAVLWDVPCSNPFAPWVEQLFAEGITGGCGGGNDCPDNPSMRGQMAVPCEDLRAPALRMLLTH